MKRFLLNLMLTEYSFKQVFNYNILEQYKNMHKKQIFKVMLQKVEIKIFARGI